MSSWYEISGDLVFKYGISGYLALGGFTSNGEKMKVKIS